MAGMYVVSGWGKESKEAKFTPVKFQRNLPGDNDVTFDIKYCGICHSDVHIANSELGPTPYPCVPGHELAGVVTAVGRNVGKFSVGDQVGVGCIVDSCMACDSCAYKAEHYCEKTMTMTYGRLIDHGHLKTNTGYTFGGYSSSYTVNQRYLVKIPSSYPLENAGPLFCAAITMYSPLARWGAPKGGKNIGIIGIGGLGQMGVQLAKAMGNKVTAISTSPNKKATALEIGADDFITSTDPESMKTGDNSLDLILNTVSANHQLSVYLPLLRRNGTIVQLGAVIEPHAVSQAPLIYKGIHISGSKIGGMEETQDCMDFCAKHNIMPRTKLITANELDDVYETLQTKNDQVVRYVLDIEASKRLQ